MLVCCPREKAPVIAIELPKLAPSGLHISLYDGFRPVIAVGQLLVPMAGVILKRNADITTGPSLFSGRNPRCGPRRIGTGEGLGIGAFDLVGPSSGMFHDLVNNFAQGGLLTLVDVIDCIYLNPLP
jgi:hypothetical protein